MPAYTGSVWIDPQTARVLRIEMEGQGHARRLPDRSRGIAPRIIPTSGSATRSSTCCPYTAENLSCQRGTLYCSRNVIDFRNYHKYTGESSIKFGGETKEDKKQ